MPSGCWAGSGGAAQGRGAFPLALLSTGAPSTNLTWCAGMGPWRAGTGEEAESGPGQRESPGAPGQCA